MEIAAIASVISGQGQVFLRPKNARKEAELAHSQFKDKSSDHISLLTAFEAFKLFGSQEWCEENFLNFRVLDGALKAQGQLINLLQKLNIPIPSVSRTNPERNRIIIQALLQGMFMNVAFFNEAVNGYVFMKNPDVASIHRASTLFKKAPKCVIFSEYVFTDKDYIRTVSEVDEKWIIPSNVDYFNPERTSNEKFKAVLTLLQKQYKSMNRSF